MKSTKKIQKSRDDSLSIEDIVTVEQFLDAHGMNMEKFVFTVLAYGGLRASELVHMEKSWLHIEDQYAKDIGIDHIQIPAKGKFCECRDCKLQRFLEEESNKPNIKYTKEWYLKIRQAFDPDVLPGRYWQPKTENSVRKIPVVYPNFKNVLTGFYGTHNELGYSRQRVWQIINQISKDVWGSKTLFDEKRKLYRVVPKRTLYPHALRATAASLWSQKGMSAASLKAVMGWSSIEIADIYVKSDERQALVMAKNLAER